MPRPRQGCGSFSLSCSFFCLLRSLPLCLCSIFLFGFLNYFSFSMSICIVEFRLRAPLVPHSHPFFALSASLLSTLLSCLAKNCAKNQFCLLFFCNVFLAKTNPHASPIAISLCCVSFPLPFWLHACANVRFGSLRVSFLFFLFLFLRCFVETSYHLPPG